MSDRWTQYDEGFDESGAKTLTVKDSLKQESIQRAKKVGINADVMAMALRMERKDRPFVVEMESVEGWGHFYRCTQEGPSKILYINTAHPFFSECYMAPGSTPSFRAGLEIFLWVLGLSELEANPEDAKIYLGERYRWSQRLAPALKILAEINEHDAMREMEAMEDWEREASGFDPRPDDEAL